MRELEAEVLECLGGAPEEHGCPAIVAAGTCEISLGNPSRRTVGARGELAQRVLGLCKRLIGFVEASLVEQRAPEHEPRVPDLVGAILAPSKPAKRMTRVLLRGDRIPGLQAHLGERRHDRRDVVVVAVLERERERLAEPVDGTLGLAEQELEPTEVVRAAVRRSSGR